MRFDSHIGLDRAKPLENFHTAVRQASLCRETEGLRDLTVVDKGDGIFAVNRALPDLRPTIGIPDARRRIL